MSYCSSVVCYLHLFKFSVLHLLALCVGQHPLVHNQGCPFGTLGAKKHKLATFHCLSHPKDVFGILAIFWQLLLTATPVLDWGKITTEFGIFDMFFTS